MFLTRQSPHITIIPRGPAVPIEYYEGKPGHEELGGEAWRLDVGAQCNRLLDRAQLLEMNAGRFNTIEGGDLQIAADIRSIVARVAQFEDLETE